MKKRETMRHTRKILSIADIQALTPGYKILALTTKNKDNSNKIKMIIMITTTTTTTTQL